MSGAADSLGDAFINVLADTSGLGAGLSRARAITTAHLSMVSSSVAAGAMKIAAPLAALAGIGMSVHSAFEGMMGAIGKGGALYDLSQQTGVAVKDLAVLQTAFKNAGASAGMVPRTIMQMQRAITSQKMAPMFAKIGIDTTALKGMGAAAQFQTIGKAMSQIKDPAERTAAAMKLFGRGGFMLKGLFADPNAIKDAKEGLGSMPDIMARNAKVFDAFGDALGMFKEKMSGFWAGIVSGLTPLLNMATKWLASFDIAAWGQKIGIALGVVAELFKNGKLGEVMWLSFKIGFTQILNYGIKVLKFLGDLSWITFTTMFKALMSIDFWKGLAQVIVGALAGIGAGLFKLLEGSPFFKIMSKAMSLVGINVAGAGELVRNKAADIAGDQMSKGMENIAKGADLSKAGKEIGKSWTKSMAEPGLFSSKDAEAQRRAIVDPLYDKVKKSMESVPQAGAEAAGGGGVEAAKTEGKGEMLQSAKEIGERAQKKVFETEKMVKDQLVQLQGINQGLQEANDKLEELNDDSLAT